ncbi:4Fe-4S cluster-binding domain-containing protein [Thermodesulfobacterium sp. TA1]|uniref:radical SAM protein n=1 Tax=Thermodesulfobacterium sp. TA1 TaxID=2234087 RepID=UPI001231C28A|nr:radical SAM protein [Thermodesulfobacterium sp. TA1]QER42867.1 4Fe-4S cluster-binding domain-containing protein [Thermodesulfobacterium sp. TA1]
MITLEEFLKDSFPIIYHITVTGKCNASCEGCLNGLIYGERNSFASSWEEAPEKTFQAVDWLLHKTNGNPVFIAFYGGEPLLVFEKVREIFYKLRALHPYKHLKFVLYTNGTLLKRVVKDDPEFFKRLDLLMVSIDGTKDQHERVRKGTSLLQIENNLEFFKSQSDTKVLMWSTLREEMSFQDCLEEFLKLYQRGVVDFFFWHLIERDYPIKDFISFRENYLKDLTYLLDRFVVDLSKGTVLPVLPLAELMFFLLKGIKRGQTGCGVEKLRSFDVLSGKVIPCVDMGENLVLADFRKNEVETLDFSKIQKELLSLVSYKEWLGCNLCEAEFFCGGRCPVLIKTSPERAKQYCILIKDLVDLAKSFLPEVKRALKASQLSEESLYYPYGYLNLLTDVIP